MKTKEILASKLEKGMFYVSEFASFTITEVVKNSVTGRVQVYGKSRVISVPLDKLVTIRK